VVPFWGKPIGFPNEFEIKNLKSRRSLRDRRIDIPKRRAG
jgi:hypothetical protein